MPGLPKPIEMGVCVPGMPRCSFHDPEKEAARLAAARAGIERWWQDHKPGAEGDVVRRPKGVLSQYSLLAILEDYEGVRVENRRLRQGIEQIKVFRDALEAAGLLARERSRAT